MMQHQHRSQVEQKNSVITQKQTRQIENLTEQLTASLMTQYQHCTILMRLLWPIVMSHVGKKLYGSKKPLSGNSWLNVISYVHS